MIASATARESHVDSRCAAMRLAHLFHLVRPSSVGIEGLGLAQGVRVAKRTVVLARPCRVRGLRHAISIGGPGRIVHGVST